MLVVFVLFGGFACCCLGALCWLFIGGLVVWCERGCGCLVCLLCWFSCLILVVVGCWVVGGVWYCA